MNSENSDFGQVAHASLGRQIHQRMATFGTLDLLYEAIELQSHGEVIAAKHLIERAIDAIEDGGRSEAEIIAEIADLPPVFAIDGWLHGRRHDVLDKFAMSLGWAAVWAGETFRASLEDGSFDLHVNAADGWRCTSGMPDVLVYGVGLTALHAHLKCENLAATVARLAPWYLKSTKGGRV
ncbi:hypothetical protein LJR245_004537 [Rhizobium leguminosarum]|uniref:Uncharacterized protein n=2 Tax=Rhizobium TaxID=379 RepID=A0A179BT01_RHILE|nr:hypothetical protein [Rhizobium leguminosarum]OAP94812.1 hypothetical protein A4U53_19595 [Rhizobium leguminosarum]